MNSIIVIILSSHAAMFLVSSYLVILQCRNVQIRAFVDKLIEKHMAVKPAVKS